MNRIGVDPIPGLAPLVLPGDEVGLEQRTQVVGDGRLGAVALGALTPSCSCATTAIVLGALASSVPWAPIVGFVASSPLTSPEEFVLSVGLFGPRFAITFFCAAIVVGLLGGLAAWLLESRGLLDGQSRMATPSPDRAGAQCCAQRVEPLAPAVAGGRLLEVIEP